MRRMFTCAAAALAMGAAAAPARSAAQTAAPRSDTTVTLKSVGTALEFVPDRISVKHGARVRVRYTNDGTLPHNLVFAKSADDLDALVSAAYESGLTGFVPVALKDKFFAYSTLVSPGQTVELTFAVPPPGEYPFICLFPGHGAMMTGTLRALR